MSPRRAGMEICEPSWIYPTTHPRGIKPRFPTNCANFDFDDDGHNQATYLKMTPILYDLK